MDPFNWNKLPSLTALRAFEATAHTGSFSAAARSLNVTHAAVAQQVTALEEHLGVELVGRSPRGITLTHVGQSIADRLRNGFAMIAEGVQEIVEHENDRPVRVTTTAFFSEAVIFPQIASFWSAHPQTEVSFTPSDLTLDIVKEGFDIAVRAGGGHWPGLTSIPLLDCPTLALAAPALVDDPSTDWSALPWLLPDDSLWEREALTASGIDTTRIKTIDLGNPSLEIRAGEEGMGLVLEAEVDVRSQLNNGTLKIAPIPIPFVSSFFIVTPPWPPRPAVRNFITWLARVGSGYQTG